MSLPVDDKQHELRLGHSFEPQSKVGFHSIRYDFKPASVDTSKEACVEVGRGNQVTVTVPHIEGSGVPHTVFKGNKQPVMKECVLIIDHERGTYTLEKLTSKVTLKKTRVEGSSKAIQQISGRVTPVDLKKNHTPTKTKNKPVKVASEEIHSAPLMSDLVKGSEDSTAVAEMSDSSSSSSDNEMEDVAFTAEPSYSRGPKHLQPPPPPPPPPPPQHRPAVRSYNVLDNDLALSESGSDSDSDD